MTSSPAFADGGIADPAEIRRLVEKAKERGLIAGGTSRPRPPAPSDRQKQIRKEKRPAPIDKEGAPVVRDAPAPPAEVAIAAPAEFPKGLNSLWILITPEVALRWLANNVRNRPISDDVVLAYARDMKNGEWEATHQGIAFNDRDELIDGQHRLHAVAASGCTVRMMVTFGLPSVIEGKEVTPMDCVDRGRTRSVADQLKIQHGMRDGSLIAAVSMGVARLCFQERTRRLSVGQTLEIYRAFQAPIGHVIENRSKERGLRSAGVLAAFAFALAVDPRLKLMFSRLNSGLELVEGSPMQQLRAFLTSEEAILLNRGSDRAIAELVLHAILLEIRGKHVPKLGLSPQGAAHFRSLQQDRVERVAELFRLPQGISPKR